MHPEDEPYGLALVFVIGLHWPGSAPPAAHVALLVVLVRVAPQAALLHEERPYYAKVRRSVYAGYLLRLGLSFFKCYQGGLLPFVRLVLRVVELETGEPVEDREFGLALDVLEDDPCPDDRVHKGKAMAISGGDIHIGRAVAGNGLSAQRRVRRFIRTEYQVLCGIGFDVYVPEA